MANLSTQLFRELSSLHALEEYEQHILEYAALLHEVGQYISFKRYHKNSRYIIKHSRLRGFTNEEILLVRHVARYHRKAEPSKSQKKYRKLSKRQRNVVDVLAGILRIAVGLNTTKNHLVRDVHCRISKKEIRITPSGSSTLDIELWAADRNKRVLEEALDRKITVVVE